MKFKIYKLREVTSTNDVAIQLIKEKNETSGFIHAEKQTKGRGRHGKKWISKKGNLFASIFFPLKSNYPSYKEFALITPIIITNIIEKYCKKKDVLLKFPNDILVNNKKICGILQETITLNKTKFLIIGIGINIISSPKILNKYKATNMMKESNSKLSTNELINKLVKSYEIFFSKLKFYKYETFKKKAEGITLVY
jgi:BirA family transcriptional regulator, biotin operon repressor / biotin---[acetyl-CoA-carboxylase] ligase